MTNHYIDFRNADVILNMGSNVAENHPVSFKWIQAAKEKGAIFIHVDPRFTRTSTKADIFARLRSGTDIAFLGGMIKYILDNNLYDEFYVKNYTNASFIVNPNFSFDDGLFSGYDPNKRAYDQKTWALEKDENGIPKRDMSLQDPRCVFQLLKKHYSRYTPEKVTQITGTPADDLLKKCTRPTVQREHRTRPEPSYMPWAGRNIPWACRISGPCPSSSCFWEIWGLPGAG
jgi:formate dehydrogenase major subunit